jgi:hypothetical protein
MIIVLVHSSGLFVQLELVVPEGTYVGAAVSWRVSIALRVRT